MQAVTGTTFVPDSLGPVCLSFEAADQIRYSGYRLKEMPGVNRRRFYFL